MAGSTSPDGRLFGEVTPGPDTTLRQPTTSAPSDAPTNTSKHPLTQRGFGRGHPPLPPAVSCIMAVCPEYSARKEFPGRFAQVVDHPYKCRRGTPIGLSNPGQRACESEQEVRAVLPGPGHHRTMATSGAMHRNPPTSRRKSMAGRSARAGSASGPRWARERRPISEHAPDSRPRTRPGVARS